MVLFLFGNIFLLELGSDFSQNKIFCVEVKLLPVFQHGFLRTAENVYIHNFYGIIWEKVFPFNFVIGILWHF